MIKQGNDKVNRILYRGTDDVARAVLGGDWRMPTRYNFSELVNNCDLSVVGNICTFTSKINGATLTMYKVSYWSSNKIDWANDSAYDLYFRDNGTANPTDNSQRRNQFAIRAVSETQGVDLGLPSGLRWAECNLGATLPTQIGNLYQWGDLKVAKGYQWSTYKFNPSGDGATFTKYNNTDGKRTLELDCECEIEKVMQGGDVIFFKPIEYTKDFGGDNLSLVSACAVLDALQEVTTPQTITFSAYTSALIMDDDTAMEKVMSAMEIGWNIVLN